MYLRSVISHVEVLCFSEGGTTTVLEHTFRMQNALLTSQATCVCCAVTNDNVCDGFHTGMRVEDVIIMYVRCGCKKATVLDSFWVTCGF